MKSTSNSSDRSLMLDLSSAVMIGRSFWTLLRVSELRSVWKMVTKPSRLAWLLAVQCTSSPSILSTCRAQPGVSKDLSCIRCRQATLLYCLQLTECRQAVSVFRLTSISACACTTMRAHPVSLLKLASGNLDACSSCRCNDSIILMCKLREKHQCNS